MTNIRSKGHTPHAFAVRAATFLALFVACTNTPPPTAPCPPGPATESAEASTEGAASKAAAAPRRFVINRSEIVAHEVIEAALPGRADAPAGASARWGCTFRVARDSASV
jgi:hypothetical protein